VGYRIIAFRDPGLIVKRGWSRQFMITYGEILTAERLASPAWSTPPRSHREFASSANDGS
jgi:hypothetical protein